jgi:hypothetical protein
VAGFVYTEIGPARLRVVYDTCWNCLTRMCVPLREVARQDGVLVCPHCGKYEPLSEARCRDIARILARPAGPATREGAG